MAGRRDLGTSENRARVRWPAAARAVGLERGDVACRADDRSRIVPLLAAILIMLPDSDFAELARAGSCGDDRPARSCELVRQMTQVIMPSTTATRGYTTCTPLGSALDEEAAMDPEAPDVVGGQSPDRYASGLDRASIPSSGWWAAEAG